MRKNSSSTSIPASMTRSHRICPRQCRRDRFDRYHGHLRQYQRCRWPRVTRWRYCTYSAVTTFRSIPESTHPIAPATLPKMRGTTPDERGPRPTRALAERRRGRLANGRFVVTNSGLGGGPPSQRHRRRNHPRLPARSGSTRLGGRFHHSPPRANTGPDLTIVPTGAMTTMATVFRNAPDLKDSGERTLMGGALTLPGNVSPAAEANISQDPEAADYLFKCGAAPPMIGLDVTHQTALTR